MGKRGPAPKPTALKLLAGNAGHRPLNDDEPEGKPWSKERPPEWLPVGSRARKFWYQLVPLLNDMRVLRSGDQVALAMLCDVLDEYVMARDVVRRRGMTYKSVATVGGRDPADDDDENDEEDPPAAGALVSIAIRKRPEVQIAADAWRRIKIILQEFGLTPSARSRVKANDDSEEDDIDRMFSSGRGRKRP
jgi:P27 family predicted phage terminase small subunit